MQTNLSAEFKGTKQGALADDILRSCVHCGFCNATCPTYQLLGDELDGPRGRIYLIKQLLEGGTVGRSTQVHLDRCLTCLNCETTCPSGVKYGQLVSIGRSLVDARVTRPPLERFKRWALREGLTSRWFGVLFKAGRAIARAVPGALPRVLRDKIAASGVNPVASPQADHSARGRLLAPEPRRTRKVLLLEGCVQPAMLPNVNRATVRVLDAAGIETITVPGTGCCGALREHLGDQAGSRGNARQNIDAWWPIVSKQDVECVIANASACSLELKAYGDHLQDDAAYAEKAQRVAAMARDLSELLPDISTALAGRLAVEQAGALVYHAPCTLQHGLKVRGMVEQHLTALGFDLRTAGADAHLCCGSAGAYSVLQPGIARELRDRKLAVLTAKQPTCIVSANVGCIQHLQTGTALPVRHWIEILDDALPASYAEPIAANARGQRE